MSNFWGFEEKSSYEKLSEDIKTNVLVIGGGIAGILIAYKLQENGLDVMLVEKNVVGNGITKNTTATLSLFQDKLYKDRINDDGIKIAKGYFDASKNAISEYEKLALKFDFDYQKCSSYLYSENSYEELELEYEALKKIGAQVSITKDILLPINNVGAIKIDDQGMFNPCKLINELKKHLKIYENTEIVKVNNKYALTKDNHKIVFEKAVIATHYPINEFKGMYFLKMHQIRSQVAILDDNIGIKDIYLDINKGGMYFRNYKDKLLVGGNDYRVGECGNKYPFINKVNTLLKTINSDFFSNQDLITLDEMPYIGRLSYYDDKIYVATGFNGYGMSNAMISACLLSDLFLERKNDFVKQFCPQRSYKFKPLMRQIKTAIVSYFKFGKKRCKHLGCTLTYNKHDNTYECLCHGSRYESDGKFIDDPTKKNLNI